MKVSDPVDFLWKMMGLAGAAAAAILWMLRMQSNKTKSDSENKSRFDSMEKKNDEQDRHMESQDERAEKVTESISRLSEQINQFGIFDLKLKQLEKENSERKEENKLIMGKLDSIFNKMNQIELSVNNKANRT